MERCPGLRTFPGRRLLRADTVVGQPLPVHGRGRLCPARYPGAVRLLNERISARGERAVGMFRLPSNGDYSGFVLTRLHAGETRIKLC
jgi:hypothetical protein